VKQKSPLHIAFHLAHGFAARMIIRTAIARRLVEQGVRVTAISPNADEPYFQRECELEQIGLRQQPGRRARISHWFRTYRPYFLDDVMNNPCLKAHHLRRFKNRPMSGSLMELLNRTIAPNHMFREFCRAVERRVNRSKQIKEILRSLKPTLLVLTNPFGVDETVYLLHARELGIPVVCQLLSWDNITSKGTPLLMPDYFISWGPIMTAEMVDLYNFPRERIYECGVAHFDIYNQKNGVVPRDALLKQLGLPPEVPYILYGMGPEYSSPNEIDIVAWLAKQINSNAFAYPCSLVIRPHPQTISGEYARSKRDLDLLKKLVGPRVALDSPPVLSEKLAWDLPTSDMSRLASLLDGCAMCLNAGSTLSLDASMANRPVIIAGFDGWEDLPYEKSARQGLEYIHIAKLLKLGGIRTARSFSELELHINTYLINPRADEQARLFLSAQECGPRDGRSAERVATVLMRLLASCADLSTAVWEPEDALPQELSSSRVRSR
jgi:hypothetical protein